MDQVFDGIKVVDFSRGMPGSIATMVMSDFGAEVIKVEPPGGDPFRDVPGAVQWNRGKKSVVIDLKTSEGQLNARKLSQQADVVIENFRPGVTKRLGIDYEKLSSGRADLVYCSLTGFGSTGPYANYKGYEGIVLAKSGRMMWFSGQNRREGPNYVSVPNASHSAASAIIRGVVSALYVRDRTGQGQKVETSLLQTVTLYDLREWIIWQMTVKDPETYHDDPSLLRSRGTTGYIAARTKEGGWIQLANVVERLFRLMMHKLDVDFIYQDPHLKSAPILTDKDRDTLYEIIIKRVQEKTSDEWMDIFMDSESTIAAEPYMTAEYGMSHSQLRHNGQVVDIDDPVFGNMKQLGPMVMMRGAEGTPKSPAPTLGQHTEEILGGLNGAVISSRKQGVHDIPKYPLDGITVLDLTTFINGPLAASLLTELGARVIRIETLEGDWLRHNWYGLCVHRTMAGTESLSLDLKTPEGKKVLEQLIAKTDILLHNMRPGAPERLGFGYDQALKINPRLVYVYAAGYGSTGPHSHRPSMHPVPGAVCGGALAQLGRDILPPSEEHMTVDEINEVSWRLGRANDGTADQNSTMAVSVAMLLGLYAREKTGNPQYLESTLLGGNAYANAEDFFWHEGKAPRLIPDSDGYGLHALYRLYQAQTGWVFLACPFEKEWRAFCETVGRSDLIEDKRFADSKDREHNDAALAEEIGRVFETQDAVYWEKLLTAADVACVQAEDRGMYQFFNDDPHVLENGFITHVETLRLGKFWRHSPILHFSHTESRTGVGPLKGEHTRTILEELGYSDVTILDFKERGLVDWEEP